MATKKKKKKRNTSSLLRLIPVIAILLAVGVIAVVLLRNNMPSSSMARATESTLGNTYSGTLVIARNETLYEAESNTSIDFVAEEGSAIISIKPAYLESLSVGKHSLTAQFDDGLATTDFTVQDDGHAVKPDKRGQKLPQTGDGTFGAWWAALASAGLAMLAGGLMARGKAGAR